MKIVKECKEIKLEGWQSTGKEMLKQSKCNLDCAKTRQRQTGRSIICVRGG